MAPGSYDTHRTSVRTYPRAHADAPSTAIMDVDATARAAAQRYEGREVYRDENVWRTHRRRAPVGTASTHHGFRPRAFRHAGISPYVDPFGSSSQWRAGEVF